MRPAPYPRINPPYFPDFAKASKGELKDYYTWFIEAVPENTAELAKLVKASRGFEQWQPNNTAASLEPLGKWFGQQVETRLRSAGEIEAIRAQSPYPIEVPRDELSDRTLAIALQVAMYFAEVFRHQYRTVQWHHSLENKKSVHYGQPVLTGFGKSQELNPLHIVIVLAYAIANRERDGSRLLSLYDVWSKKVVSQ